MIYLYLPTHNNADFPSQAASFPDGNLQSTLW